MKSLPTKGLGCTVENFDLCSTNKYETINNECLFINFRSLIIENKSRIVKLKSRRRKISMYKMKKQRE